MYFDYEREKLTIFVFIIDDVAKGSVEVANILASKQNRTKIWHMKTSSGLSYWR